MVDARPLTLAEHACLALVAEGVEHGWAIGTLLSPEGELGRIWSLSRPLTYRALDGLVERRLVRREARAGAGRRERHRLTATAAGRAAVRRWLDEPVEHLRDVRTELLVKLALRHRAGLEAAPLLASQRARFAPRIEHLVTAPGTDPVELWRAESARAVRRFLDRALDPTPPPRGTELRVSARNQLHATVMAVGPGDVLATVKVRLPDGQTLTAAITREAIDDLDLAAGDQVVALVKSTEVMIGKA